MNTTVNIWSVTTWIVNLIASLLSILSKAQTTLQTEEVITQVKTLLTSHNSSLDDLLTIDLMPSVQESHSFSAVASKHWQTYKDINFPDIASRDSPWRVSHHSCKWQLPSMTSIKVYSPSTTFDSFTFPKYLSIELNNTS